MKDFYSRADYKWATELNQFSLTLLGVWPEYNKTRKKKLLSNIRVIVVLNIMTWSCTIPSLHSLLRIWDNLMSTVDNLQYTLPLLMAMTKLFIMWYKEKGIYIYTYIMCTYTFTMCLLRY